MKYLVFFTNDSVEYLDKAHTLTALYENVLKIWEVSEDEITRDRTDDIVTEWFETESGGWEYDEFPELVKNKYSPEDMLEHGMMSARKFREMVS